ncbi:TIGR01244 family sulfur transferase [Oceaniglobus ichthyenteri]|uniref:TIGR01244 family sulfur transferase n=1 Tax=Oceaniglobus ichthyenteri TaxID=2136177 RepID=UPI000D3723FF|nr:TIGR01244 family sulfur transferase [Oceaniglobus ichthyenteri]
MQINALTEDYAVGAQIQPGDVPALKEAGYTAVICNRPDEEVAEHEASAAIKAAAEAAGLTFHFNPVTNGAMTHENVNIQGTTVANATGPVFAYCRSGTRSAIVWAFSQAGKQPADTLITAAARGGYDLSGLRGQLQGAQT